MMIKPLLTLLVSVLFVSLSMAAQSPTAVVRLNTFLLGNEHFDLSGNWKAVFCRSEDERICVLTNVAIEESKDSREQLPDGRMANIFTYQSRPGYRAVLFVKGLNAAVGEISSALSISVDLSSDPSFVPWAVDTYQIRLDRFNLVIEKTDNNNAMQVIPLFKDPYEGCKDVNEADIRRNVNLTFMGDIDRDHQPDFIISASAYRSCAQTISGRDLHFLILSSEAKNGQLGKIVQSAW
jgi:hypothetical protein